MWRIWENWLNFIIKIDVYPYPIELFDLTLASEEEHGTRRDGDRMRIIMITWRGKKQEITQVEF